MISGNNNHNNMTQVTISDYLEAQRNPTKRQEFLNAIDLEEAKDFVFTVRYANFNQASSIYSLEKKIECATVMATCNPKINFFGFPLSAHKQSGVIVFKHAFEYSLPVFLSSLIDHEGQHARQQYKKSFTNSRIIQIMRKTDSDKEREYLKSIKEVPACANELANAKKRGLSEEEFLNADKYFSIYYNNLADYHSLFKKPRCPWRDLKKILCDSPGDDLVRKLLNP